MRKLIFFIIVLLTAVVVYGKTIWQDKDLYSSRGDFANGDIIIVDIRDLTDMKFQVSFGSDSTYSITSNPDQNITKFLPKISSDRKTVTNRRNQFTNSGKLNFSIASTIVGRAGRLYRIYGIRSYTFNGMRNQVTVRGIVSPAMVNGNRVNSNEIANFQLAFSGARQGKFTLEKIKDDKKETGKKKEQTQYLTDKDKQQIIKDYLEKVIRELMQ